MGPKPISDEERLAELLGMEYALMLFLLLDRLFDGKLTIGLSLLIILSEAMRAPPGTHLLEHPLLALVITILSDYKAWIGKHTCWQDALELPMPTFVWPETTWALVLIRFMNTERGDLSDQFPPPVRLLAKEMDMMFFLSIDNHYNPNSNTHRYTHRWAVFYWTDPVFRHAVVEKPYALNPALHDRDLDINFKDYRTIYYSVVGML